MTIFHIEQGLGNITNKNKMSIKSCKKVNSLKAVL